MYKDNWKAIVKWAAKRGLHPKYEGGFFNPPAKIKKWR